MATNFSFGNLFYFECEIFKVFSDGDLFKVRYRRNIIIALCSMTVLFIAGAIANTVLSVSVQDFGYNMMFTSALTDCFLNALYLLIFRRQFLRLYSEITTEEIFLLKNDDEVKLVSTGLQFFKMSRRLFVIMIWIGVLFVLLCSLERNQYLPSPAWTPFDVSYIVFFIICYIQQMISICILIIFITLCAIIVMGFSYFIGTQCDLVCYDSKKHFSSEQKTLKNIVGKHVRIQRLAHDCGKLLNPLFYINFLFLIIITSTGLFSSSEASTADLLLFCYLVICVYIFALIQCWFVDEMKRKSELILRAAYECPWPDASTAFKKELLIFMENTKQPITFGVVGLVPMSLETFITILRSSFSYYTVLQNLNNLNRS